MMKTVVLVHIFVETVFSIKILWWLKNPKIQHLFEIEIYCNLINVFTDTFNQFNASLLNKSIYLINFF